ncbi:MAG: hypothetical protein EBZ77_02135 [Chitinophagia bacterium]|nr:hypothetical protein [Chitinophagia bacterium]
MKKIAFLLLLAACVINVHAQDHIYKVDGGVIEARIVAVHPHTIWFTLWNSSSQAQQSIRKSDVLKLVYQNGREETYLQQQTTNHALIGRFRYQNGGEANLPLKSNLLSISPIAFSEDGAGLGVSYEKGLGKDGYIAYCLPFSVSISHPEKASYPANYNGNTAGRNNDYMFYFTPGIKVYPSGYKGWLKYSIGPSLVLGAGRKTQTDDRYTYVLPDPLYYKVSTKFLVGILLNNSVTYNLSTHYSIGADLAFGLSYLDLLDSKGQGMNGVVQGGVRFGIRY